jgi:hypothetical protein
VLLIYLLVQRLVASDVNVVGSEEHIPRRLYPDLPKFTFPGSPAPPGAEKPSSYAFHDVNHSKFQWGIHSSERGRYQFSINNEGRQHRCVRNPATTALFNHLLYR